MIRNKLRTAAGVVFAFAVGLGSVATAAPAVAEPSCYFDLSIECQSRWPDEPAPAAQPWYCIGDRTWHYGYAPCPSQRFGPWK